MFSATTPGRCAQEPSRAGEVDSARPSVANAANAGAKETSASQPHPLLTSLQRIDAGALAVDEGKTTRSPRQSFDQRFGAPRNTSPDLNSPPTQEQDNASDSTGSPLLPSGRHSTESWVMQAPPYREQFAYMARTPAPHQAPFLSRHTLASAAALAGYTALNAATVASVQDRNPSAAIGLVGALTMNVPRVVGEMLHCAVLGRAHEMDRTMYVRVVGAAVTGALTAMAQNYPESLGFDADRRAAYLLKAMGWAAFASTIVDATVNAILRALGGKSLIYTQRNSTRADLADPALRLCSLDYLGAQAWTLTKKMIRNSPSRVPGGDDETELEMPPIAAYWSLASEIESMAAHRSRERAEPPPFNSAQTYVWVTAAIAYATINSVMAHYNQKNLPNLLSLLHNLIGFLPVMIGDLLKKASENEPFVLDKTMATKIIAVAVIGSLMSVANHRPETMGLSDENKIAHTLAAVGWATLATLIVELTANFVQRSTAGVSTVYNDPSPDALGDSSRYWFSGDFVLSRAGALAQKWWS